MTNEKIRENLDGLVREGEKVLATRKYEGRVSHVDSVAASQWATNLKALLRSVFGERSDHYVDAKQHATQLSYGDAAARLLAVARAALSAWDNGYGVQVSPPEATARLHIGELVVGTKHTSTVTGSTVGAVALGDHATAIGTVNLGASLTQEQHRAALKDAQKALLDDEDRLDALTYEALGQFLQRARAIHVEQKQLTEVEAAMKSVLDQVWVQHLAQGMKPQALPQTLEVVGALARHPAAGEVVRKLVGAPS